MSRIVIAVVFVAVSLGHISRAHSDDDDALYKCHAAPGKISASFKPNTSITDLVTWVIGFTCKNVILPADVIRQAPSVTIVSPNKMTPKQALQLFVDAVESTGLVVVQKADTIIIKLGPNMAKGCPDPIGAAPAPTPSATGNFAESELDAGIKVIDETHREVTQALATKLRADSSPFETGTRIVPAIKLGKPSGIKLYAIRPSSIYAKLGFSNGDTIESINKISVVSAEAIATALPTLRAAKRFEVVITRRDKPVTLVIDIK